MRRIKATFDSESPARSEGLKQDAAIAAGFDCACGKHSAFSKYAIAHWSEVLHYTCAQCGREHRMLKGVVTEMSGPKRRQSKIKIGALAEPTKPLWRCYQPLNNGARGITYTPASDYAESLDAANDLAWTYCNKVEPHNKSRREDLFRTLIRREEYPLLSTIEVSGLVVGGGNIQMLGNRLDPARGQVAEIELRTPKGEVSRITFTKEVLDEIARGFELKPMTATEALAKRQRKEK